VTLEGKRVAAYAYRNRFFSGPLKLFFTNKANVYAFGDRRPNANGVGMFLGSLFLGFYWRKNP